MFIRSCIFVAMSLFAPSVQSLPVQMIQLSAVVKDQKKMTPLALNVANEGGKKLKLEDAVDEYKWPNNLYDEMRDMAALSFIIYKIGYIIDSAKRAREDGLDFVGLDVDPDGHVTKAADPDGKVLTKTLTPGELKDIVDNNVDILMRYHKKFFKDRKMLMATLEELDKKAEESGKAITLEEFDDKFQTEECVYAVTKDDVNKRITVVFRGTDNAMAGKSNWLTNLNALKKKVSVPAILRETMNTDELRIHEGFYSYIFGQTTAEGDGMKRKYDQILEDVMPLLEANPNHKLYITGHSLGAALSTVASFFLSCEKGIQTPVTCINFASPRAGDKTFLSAVTEQEKSGRLRMVRSVNENDSVTAAPSAGFKHVGIQIKQYKVGMFGGQKKPEIYYPKENIGWGAWTRQAWGNSHFSMFNVGYDHGDYRERIDAVKEDIQSLDLNTLYENSELTGFVIDH